MIMGKTVTKITTDGIAATTIKYVQPQQRADVKNNGPGTIYVNWCSTAQIDNDNDDSLPIGEGEGYEIRSSHQWDTLSIISDQPAKVVVVIL